MTSDIDRLLVEQFKLQQQISSSKKVNAPSDVGAESVVLMRAHRRLERIDQYRLNLDQARSWMTSSESNMDSMLELLKRAKTLAEQMATGTYDANQQEGVASEVGGLFNELVSLLNAVHDGSYIFAGTRTDSAAISKLIAAADPASLRTSTVRGHGTVASAYYDGSNYHLRLTRDTTGNSATITISGSNTLGESASVGLSFDWPANWTETQPASADQAQILTHNANLSSTSTIVSDRVGEEFIWSAEASAGTNTYRTSEVITVTGPGTVTIDGTLYPPVGTFADAAELVELINSSGSADYFAWLEGSTKVHVVSKGTGPFSITAPTGGVSVTHTSLQKVVDDINNGVQAAGMWHIDGSSPGFPPAPSDTITLGNYTWTWGQITQGVSPPPSTPSEYATALANWINSQTDEFLAETTSSGSGATVQIRARAVGAAWNVTMGASGGGVSSSGALYGGLDGTDTRTTGRIYATGTSDLMLDTTVRIKVLSVDDDETTLRLRWYDDDGQQQTAEITLTGTGSSNAVSVPGLGNISIYRDSLPIYEGAEFELNLTRYQGNDEALEVSFSEGNHMRYNWTARQLAAGSMSVDLDGELATARADNTGSGSVHMSGVYRGLRSRTYHFEVVNAGSPPSDDVTLRVTWHDDKGIEHTQLVSISQAGKSAAVALPDGEGAYIYLDSGTYNIGDSFTYTVTKSDPQLLDMLKYWYNALLSGDTTTAQEVSQEALEAFTDGIKTITDYTSQAGTRMDRVDVRSKVMDSLKIAFSNDLHEMEEVDVTEAFNTLRMQQVVYGAALKVASIMSDLALVNLLPM